MGHPLRSFVRVDDPIQKSFRTASPLEKPHWPRLILHCLRAGVQGIVIKLAQRLTFWGRMVPEVRFIGSAGANVNKGIKRPAQANGGLAARRRILARETSHSIDWDMLDFYHLSRPQNFRASSEQAAHVQAREVPGLVTQRH